ncbi:hypothetical protein QE197_25135 (plasmid) [Arsenophonus nasoniae]|uniref:Uncharacterized protein n=1 Tax=Arsenophonus nasoniae TaxID=638 RepID=A0ABY8NVY4_9GAMM|nr:hypothetical protein [Arsenophonus nasoniae]WGM08520.1 hypothetical protein QE258_24240 [Arsenophonus nasoniae]WGM13797.1 hypothetical protein QE197_25135 [Arsenophonus nasoniae]WGM18404.1 hypothetical protein QE193_25010 [Arsenophonus nasoniae]
MPQKIIFLQKRDNVKRRKILRAIEFSREKAEQQVFNQKLKKAFWRHENPRQQLRDFQRQIVVYANLFMNYRKKQQKQKIIEQKAHIDALFWN